MFSPIFDNDQIIGNYYKYVQNYDYKTNYIKYSKIDQIKKMFYLYKNELFIKDKISIYNNYKDEDFYIIKKEAVSDMKAENNYNYIKQYFKGIISMPPSNREICSIVKYLQPNDLNNLNENNLTKDLSTKYEVEIIPIVNQNNQSESYMVYNNFELIDKNFASVFGEYPYHILKCSFIGNKTIAFYYPIGKLNNKYNMYLISKIDKNNNFINKYLLIYKEPKYYKSHFEKIKYKCFDFIKHLSFMNNAAPIVINGYVEIGTVIALSDITDDNYNPHIPIVIKDILKDFSGKPPIGLENIGATCYMNDTLQCLCNIRKFVNYFKYHEKLISKVKLDNKKQLLCSAFKLLIENLYPYKLSQNYQIYLSNNPQAQISDDSSSKPKNCYAPKNFKETISRMNPLFQGIAANDEKDLVNLLLMTLHDELNKISSSIHATINEGNVFQDQTNQALMLKNFINNFKENYRSVISDLFYAVNCSKTQCGNCKVVSFNYQIYFFLIFPLEEVRKFKLMNTSNFNAMNNFNLNNNTVDILDCFLYDQKINNMTGENAMYCSYCKQTCASAMQTLLTTGPEILIIILNRGKGIQFNVKINFYLDLNLSNFIELQNTGCMYELFGVITHIGESSMGGHFIAYCKDLWTNQWLKFNDAIVSPVSNFKTEVIDFAMPYLLFYQKKL